MLSRRLLVSSTLAAASGIGAASRADNRPVVLMTTWAG